jgi:hypothetical protein
MSGYQSEPAGRGLQPNLIERQLIADAPMPPPGLSVRGHLLYYLCGLILFSSIRYLGPWFSQWLFSTQFFTWEWVPTFPAMFLSALAVGAAEALLWAYLLRTTVRNLRWHRIWQWVIAGAVIGVAVNRGIGLVEHVLGFDDGRMPYKFLSPVYVFFGGPSFGLDAVAALFLCLATTMTAAMLWLISKHVGDVTGAGIDPARRRF